jgi:hypothetical protein
VQLPPSFLTSSVAAAAVPPVASTSSDDQHPLSLCNRILVDLEGVLAVFEVVALFDRLAGSFPGLRMG